METRRSSSPRTGAMPPWFETKPSRGEEAAQSPRAREPSRIQTPTGTVPSQSLITVAMVAIAPFQVPRSKKAKTKSSDIQARDSRAAIRGHENRHMVMLICSLPSNYNSCNCNQFSFSTGCVLNSTQMDLEVRFLSFPASYSTTSIHQNKKKRVLRSIFPTLTGGFPRAGHENRRTRFE